MSEPIYYGFDKFKDFEKQKNEEAENLFSHAPDECYKLYGSDLDKCSTQQSEGCGRCRLVENCNKCTNYDDPNSDKKGSFCELCFNGSNFQIES